MAVSLPRLPGAPGGACACATSAASTSLLNSTRGGRWDRSVVGPDRWPAPPDPITSRECVPELPAHMGFPDPLWFFFRLCPIEDKVLLMRMLMELSRRFILPSPVRCFDFSSSSCMHMHACTCTAHQSSIARTCMVTHVLAYN